MLFRKWAHYLASLSIILLGLIVVIAPTAAQDQTIIRLDMPSTTLQTGQFYDVAIRIENAPKFWALDLTLEYDPAMIYVFGTKSGSPVTDGELFGGVSSIVVQNKVDGNQLRYMVSKVGETAPVEGSGVIGMLRIYPLTAGTTRLQFPRLQAVALSSYDPNATDVTTSEVTIVPARLDLTIAGDTVELPAEATATPQPTETPTEGPALPTLAQPTEQPTLENIVFSTSTPAPLVVQEIPEAPSNNGVVIMAAILIVVAIIGLGALLITRGRGRK